MLKIFLCLVCFWSPFEAAEVFCEVEPEKGRFKPLCFLDEKTEINSSDATFLNERDDEVEGLHFFENLNVLYLPVRVHEKFPNLVGYEAQNCGVREISKKNFESLEKLEWLHLDGNQIEKIGSDTFEGFGKLRWIDLSRNKIKFMNGRLFEVLPKLNAVELNDNDCISKSFRLRQDVGLQALLLTVNKKCGFAETSERRKQSCGEVDETIPTNPSESKRGQWPFLVALLKSIGEEFFCGGTLISSRHVLTAGHCIQAKNTKQKLKPEDIMVLVGRHNLRSIAERGSEIRGVEMIFLHPDWKNYTEKYDGDLAILLLDEALEFSKFIQPVCLTSDPEVQNQFEGTVVGWASSDSGEGLENIQHEVAIRAVNDAVCFERDQHLGNSHKMFCAGGEESGPCIGNSDAFFVMLKGRWAVGGILSSATRNCEDQRYSLFTKVFEFSDWMDAVVGGSS